MFYIYISVCRGIYDLMHCRKLGPQGYFLYGDLETQCYTPSYYTWALGLGIPGFLLYVIGIPVMFSLILFLNRHQLTDPMVRRYLGILYNGYKLRYYWWEVIIMLRKSAIIGCVTMFYSFGESFQITCILLVLVMCMATEFAINPHSTRTVRDLERTSIVVQVFSFIITGFYQSEYVPSVVVELVYFMLNIVFFVCFAISLLKTKNSCAAKCFELVCTLCCTQRAYGSDGRERINTEYTNTVNPLNANLQKSNGNTKQIQMV